MEEIGADRSHRKDQSKHIQPHRGVHRRAQVIAEAELQQKCGQPDGCNDDQCERAQECAAAGVDNNQ